MAALDPGDRDRRDGDPSARTRQLAMTTGVFNLLWAVVVVLMIMRPGSSTSVHL